ncbi:MAG: TIGR02186 family protein [Hyphomicrobiales bacterium]
MASKSEARSEVNKAGIEQVIYALASYKHSFVYGLLAVMLAVMAGLAGWYAFRRD